MNEIVETKDGSHSLKSEQFNQTYHSVHGALAESEHVFIEAGLKPAAGENDNLTIFEMGFGTGLNAFLTAVYGYEYDLNIRYETVEQYPVDLDQIKDLNYAELINNGKNSELFQSLHTAKWDTETGINENFTLVKRNCNLKDYRSEPGSVDVIYFDAFSPNAQPELWTVDVFRQMFEMIKKGGALVTYCCKGVVRRAMLKAGFTVDKLEGPPGKREMIRATKP
ncbi:tRNA (5-methylaminomethyl-2-thiouridine)(34)-methyltransferase MnmD [Salibacter halophilus]|uniref:tRNA (5-methylaminomethyl-2-thiouridine)(34)-methyltransferase MnmD n=1 Tax=Salibacter halophilus TaxID=1803916 RepID=A0A6N6M6J2_9FLAO|nr:tRNA (5-methylaminomethyl-2-thiouridine)(34)-methyltransferase MnmD [Salibacter halophilus]KAB1065524.1 tRNA (5-methylaminomethyl-2-thiouridine)(34)-methyltransferase MnmD [Salibacter halophilus]